MVAATIWLIKKMEAKNALKVLKTAATANAKELVKYGIGFVARNKDQAQFSVKNLQKSDLPGDIVTKIMEEAW